MPKTTRRMTDITQWSREVGQNVNFSAGQPGGESRQARLAALSNCQKEGISGQVTLFPVWSRPMSNRLHSHLADLASSFATSVLAAVRGSSLEELRITNGHGRPASAPEPRVGRAAAAPKASPAKSNRRLGRRSAADISRALDGVVSLLKRNKAGLRAEQIRTELGMQAKEMPRVLSDGLSHKKLRKKGQKRATTYFAS